MSEDNTESIGEIAETLSGTTERTRETYLRFVSSELTSHAANLIGLSIILFAFLGVVPSDRVPVIINCVSPYSLIFLLLWVISTGIFFAFMRLVYYGQIAHFTITQTFEQQITDLPQLVRQLGETFQGRTIYDWFGSGISYTSHGFHLSIVVGFIASLFFFITFIWQW